MASRKEQKEALRRERQEREAREAAAAARKRLIGIVVAAILALGIVVALAVVVFAGGDDDGGGGGGSADSAEIDFPDGGQLPEQREADLKRAIKAAGCREETVEGESEHTTEPVTYESEPPAIGPHYPEWPEDALFEESPTVTRLVHTLEHGRVLIWVKPDAPEDLLAQVKALYDEDPYHVIVAPRTELKEPLAATAWVGETTGRILRCPKPNDRMWDAMRAFKEQYRDKAPEFVP